MIKKTEEEERQILLTDIKKALLSQGKGKEGKSAALKLLLELEGFTQKDGKELFELTADDYYRIEQQAKRENELGLPSYLGGEVEVPPERQLLYDQLCVDNGQVGTTEDYQVEAVDITDLPS